MTTHQPTPLAEQLHQLASSHQAYGPDELAERLKRLSREAVVLAADLAADPYVGHDRRADALDSARQLLTELVNSDSVAMVEMNIDRIGGMWLYLAELGAAYVRDGSRPGDGGEDDRDRRR
jgi:hypothetical protein